MTLRLSVSDPGGDDVRIFTPSHRLRGIQDAFEVVPGPVPQHRLGLAEVKLKQGRVRHSGLHEIQLVPGRKVRDNLAPVELSRSCEVVLLPYGRLLLYAQNQSLNNVSDIAQMLFVGATVGIPDEHKPLFAFPERVDVVDHTLLCWVLPPLSLEALIEVAQQEAFR